MGTMDLCGVTAGGHHDNVVCLAAYRNVNREAVLERLSRMTPRFDLSATVYVIHRAAWRKDR